MARRKRAPSGRELDPHQQREAKKYANPIPSREFILQTLTDHGAPLAFEQVADVLGDWREEIITSVPGELRIYSTTIPATVTSRSLYSLRF